MYERMLDRRTVPTLRELTAYCGENAERFARLNDYLSQECGTEPELCFPYGNRYGWGIAHRKKKKLVCHIFAEAGAFTVMLRLSDRQFDSVSDGLQAYARSYIGQKYPCGDGGWIHYRVSEAAHLPDIQTLLAVKCAPRA